MARIFGVDIFESTASTLTSIKNKPTALKMETSMQTIEYEPHAVFRFFAEESGASLMEYALIAAIISVIGALIFLALSKEK